MKHNHHLTSNLKHKDFVFTLAKNESGGLWDVTITSSQPELKTTTPDTNYVLLLDKTNLRSAAGCPEKSAFVQEINNGNFITWLGLTTKVISKRLPLFSSKSKM